MENRESSDYVNAWAKQGWIITAGQNNRILIFISADIPFSHTDDELIERICAAQLAVRPTGLRLSSVYYLFYNRGDLVNHITEFPGREFDL